MSARANPAAAAPLAAGALLAFHDGGEAPAGALWEAIADNHRHNRLLWDEEDLARRRNVPDSEIAKNKRAIDGFNQRRNDAIERIDEQILNFYSRIPSASNSRMNSETPGSMIDRLSILSLKVRSMRQQTQRTDVGRSHIEECARKLDRLSEQRADLAACLDRLLADCASGAAHFKIYRQFKMYNDPALNPAIYGEKK